jgi:hypothetical protein
MMVKWLPDYVTGSPSAIAAIGLSEKKTVQADLPDGETGKAMYSYKHPGMKQTD